MRDAKRIAGVALLTLGYISTITHLRKRVDFLASRRPGFHEAELIELALNELVPQGGTPLQRTSKPNAEIRPQACIDVNLVELACTP